MLKLSKSIFQRRINSSNLFRQSSIVSRKAISLHMSTSNKKEELMKVPVPWGEVAGKCIGTPTNNPVLCLHGWLDNCNTFEPLLPLLPKDNFYVLIDLPGHGLSSHFRQGMYYTMYAYVDVIERVRKYFKWKTFDLLGHSLGGNLSAIYSGTFADHVQRLMMIDSLGTHPCPVVSCSCFLFT